MNIETTYCKDCRWLRLPAKTDHFWRPLGQEEAALCTHPQARQTIVSPVWGPVERCMFANMMRTPGHVCGPEGALFQNRVGPLHTDGGQEFMG